MKLENVITVITAML